MKMMIQTAHLIGRSTGGGGGGRRRWCVSHGLWNKDNSICYNVDVSVWFRARSNFANL